MKPYIRTSHPKPVGRRAPTEHQWWHWIHRLLRRWHEGSNAHVTYALFISLPVETFIVATMAHWNKQIRPLRSDISLQWKYSRITAESPRSTEDWLQVKHDDGDTKGLETIKYVHCAPYFATNRNMLYQNRRLQVIQRISNAETVVEILIKWAWLMKNVEVEKTREMLLRYMWRHYFSSRDRKQSRANLNEHDEPFAPCQSSANAQKFEV